MTEGLGFKVTNFMPFGSNPQGLDFLAPVNVIVGKNNTGKSALVMDSDIVVLGKDINATKRRMKEEIEDVGGYAWVTEGKEIENYIPYDLFEQYYQKMNLPKFESTQKLKDYLDIYIGVGEGDAFIADKVSYAVLYSELFNRAIIEGNESLADRLDDITKLIKKWNGIKEPLAT